MEKAFSSSQIMLKKHYKYITQVGVEPVTLAIIGFFIKICEDTHVYILIWTVTRVTLFQAKEQLEMCPWSQSGC